MNSFWQGFEKQANKHHLNRIESATKNRHDLHITYRKLNGRTTKRHITPIRRTDTHLTAWDHKKQDYRTFIIKSLKIVRKAPRQGQPGTTNIA